jgi:hypothetical protein
MLIVGQTQTFWTNAQKRRNQEQGYDCLLDMTVKEGKYITFLQLLIMS